MPILLLNKVLTGRQKYWEHESAASAVGWNSVAHDGFVEVQNEVSDHRPCGCLRGGREIAWRRFADIDDFAANGLPQFTSVANHGNKVISQLSSLIAKIAKDPAGFLLGGGK